MTDHATETPPQRRLLDPPAQLGSWCGLRIPGDQIEPRLPGGVLRGNGFDQSQRGEDAEPVLVVDGDCLADVQRPAVHDPVDAVVMGEQRGEVGVVGVVADRDYPVAAAAQPVGE